MLGAVEPSPVAWCYRHNQRCEIPVLEASRVFHAAGSTCVDWSTRSRLALRGLGPHMIPFMCWLRARRHYREKLIVHECVARHPSQYLLHRQLGDSHVIISFKLCPSMIGHPCHRLRRFTLCIAKSSIVTPLTAPPSAKFYFSAVADADIYFMAETFEIDGFLAARNVSSFRALLAPGSSARSPHGVNRFPCACVVV